MSTLPIVSPEDSTVPAVLSTATFKPSPLITAVVTESAGIPLPCNIGFEVK